MYRIASKGHLDLMSSLRRAVGLYWRPAPLQQPGQFLGSYFIYCFRVRWEEPVKTTLVGDLTVLGSPPPGSGVLVAYIMNILDGLNFKPQDLNSTEAIILDYHYMIEAFKYAFAKRGELGDPQFSANVQNVSMYLM